MTLYTSEDLVIIKVDRICFCTPNNVLRCRKYMAPKNMWNIETDT